jgi:hypothetical protein
MALVVLCCLIRGEPPEGYSSSSSGLCSHALDYYTLSPSEVVSSADRITL